MSLHAAAGFFVAPLLLCSSLHAQTLPSPAQQPDKYRVTAQEKAACTSDAIRLCMHTYPDEDKLLACMKQNRDGLTATCRIAFDAGVKRRKL